MLRSVRLFGISDVVIYNCLNTVDKNYVKLLCNTAQSLSEDFDHLPELSIKPMVLFFQSRTTVPLHTYQDILQFFPNKMLPAYFNGMSFANSLDKTQPNQRGIRLDTSELTKELHTSLIRRGPHLTPAKLWGILTLITMPTKNVLEIST